MRIAHLSDLHLGFRAYPEVDRGWNLRERDVSSAFQKAIQEAARLRPDLVLLTGDLFDRPNPPSTAFLSLSRGVRTLQALLPNVPVLAIAGERDTPEAPADPGPVAVLDALPGVEAAAGAPRAVRLTELGVHALLVPHRAIRTPPLPELRPDPEARWNVLLLRAEPQKKGGGDIDLEVDPDEWDYIAVGGAHGAIRHLGHVHTAGSLERVGWNPWSEATEEKGFVVFDTDREEGEFHPIPTRALVDLAPVRVTAGSPVEGTRRLRHLIDGIPGGVDGKLVRIRLQGDLNLPEEGVDPALLSGIRQRAAHLDLRVEGEGERDAHEDAPAMPGTFGLLLPTASPLLDRAVARLMAAEGTASLEGGLEGTYGRVLRFGGIPSQILECARTLLAPPGDGSEGDGTVRTGEGAEDPPGNRASEGTLHRLAAELRVARGDAMEAEGEVEARTLEWARDRQEAETRLQGYRDRARELRERLRALEEEDAACPTCGRALAESREGLRTTLQEEWEMVVQDGRWWKRRRGQLEGKPDDLVELEGSALRLRAGVERLSEEMERKRVGAAKSGGEGGGTGGKGEEGPGVHHLEGPQPQLRRLLRRVSGYLRLWSGGQLSGIELDPECGVRVVEEGAGRAPSPGEEITLSLVLHLALLMEIARTGFALPGPLLLRGFDDRGLDPLLQPLMQLCAGGTGVSPQVLVALPPNAPRPGIPGVQGVLVSPVGDPLGDSRRVPLGPVKVGWVEGSAGPG